MMFVYAVKSSKKKLAVIGAGVAVLIAVLIYILFRSGTMPSASTGDASIRAGNEEERIAFLSQYGWDVAEDPIKVEEILIPNEFDDVYTKYNEIQVQQGFDLSAYKGCRAKRWTYTILNYPGEGGVQPTDGSIRANLIVYDGSVIGGDVSSVALDGFMHGFERPDAAGSTSASAPTTSGNSA